MAVGVLRALAALYLFCVAIPASAVQITIPRDVDPRSVVIVTSNRSNGLAVWRVDTKDGVRDYTVGGDKIIVFCPGYKTLYKNIPQSPRFERVPMLPVTLRFVRTDGSPVANARIGFRLDLNSHQFFGYYTGMADFAHVAAGLTDSNGEVRIRVPSLLDDPYFVEQPSAFETNSLNGMFGSRPVLPSRKEKESPAFRMGLSGMPGTLSPGRLEARRTYPEAVRITVVQLAKLSGRLERSFLQRNNADAPLGKSETTSGQRYRVWLEIHQGMSGYGIGIEEDGSFSTTLKPGSYTLTIEVQDAEKGLTRKVMQLYPWESFVAKEGEEYKLNLN